MEKLANSVTETMVGKKRSRECVFDGKTIDVNRRWEEMWGGGGGGGGELRSLMSTHRVRHALCM